MCYHPVPEMPRLISLAAYTVKVWNPNDKDHEFLSNFDGENADLFDFLHTTLLGIKTKTLDQEQLQQAMSVLKLDKKARTLSGTIETGQYGYESNFINVKTSKSVYKRAKDDAEMLPFYFFFEIPTGTEDGFLILQRTSNFGIRKILHWILSLEFEKQYPEMRLQFAPLLAESELERFVKGAIQKINFVRKTIPADVADAYDAGHAEVRGTIEVVIRASKGSTLPLNNFIAKIFNTNKPEGYLALEEKQKFAYDNVKAQVKVGQARRTINAANPGRLRSYYDITDTVKLGSGNQPEYESIQEQAQVLAAKLRAVLYGSGTT